EAEGQARGLGWRSERGLRRADPRRGRTRAAAVRPWFNPARSTEIGPAPRHEHDGRGGGRRRSGVPQRARQSRRRYEPSLVLKEKSPEWSDNGPARPWARRQAGGYRTPCPSESARIHPRRQTHLSVYNFSV